MTRHTNALTVCNVCRPGMSCGNPAGCLEERSCCKAGHHEGHPAFLAPAFRHILETCILPHVSIKDLGCLGSVCSTLRLWLQNMNPDVWRNAAARHVPFIGTALVGADVGMVKDIIQRNHGILQSMNAGRPTHKERIGRLKCPVISPMEDTFASFLYESADRSPGLPSPSCRLCIFDTRTCKLIRYFEVPCSIFAVKGLAYSPDAQSLTAIFASGQEAWWSVYGAEAGHQYSQSWSNVRERFEGTVSPDGCHVGAVAREGGWQIYNAHTGKMLQGLPSFSDAPLQWSKCGRLVAGPCLRDGPAPVSEWVIFGMGTGMHAVIGLLDTINVHFAPNSQTVACFTGRGFMTLCNVKSGACCLSNFWIENAGQFWQDHSVHFSADSSLFALHVADEIWIGSVKPAQVLCRAAVVLGTRALGFVPALGGLAVFRAGQVHLFKLAGGRLEQVSSITVAPQATALFRSYLHDSMQLGWMPRHSALLLGCAYDLPGTIHQCPFTLTAHLLSFEPR